MAVIQDAPLALAPGATAQRGFFGWFEPDHPAVTSDADLAAVDRALALPEAAAPRTRRRATAVGAPGRDPVLGARLLRCRDLTDAEIARFWGNELRHVEREDGRLLSFFAGARTHVVLRAKELRVLRPHGHLLRTGDHLMPDEASLTSTVWMAGVFHSLAHAGPRQHQPLALDDARRTSACSAAHGQRIFVELDDGYAPARRPVRLRDVSPSGCRWLYAHAGGLIEVRSRGADRLGTSSSWRSRSSTAPPCRFLLSHHVALNGDDGADAVPVALHARRRRGSSCGRSPTPTSAAASPTACFRIDPQAGTTIERWAATRCCSPTGGRVGSRS